MTPPPSLQDLIETVLQDSPTEGLLDQLVTASSTVAQIDDTSDALLGHFVDRCRRAGLSWSQISAALGVSKQAVHKRFSGAIADQIIAAAAEPPTFERFTPRARSTLLAASRAASSLGRDSVGTEHLLLGLFEEPEGIAARALAAMHVSHQAVEAAARNAGTAARPVDTGPTGNTGNTAGPGGEGTVDAATAARLPFGVEAQTALRDALAEALERGHNYIGTEHLLLGLYRSPDTPAAKILGQLGARHAETSTRIAEMLRGNSQSAR